MTYFTSSALYWMKQLLITNTNSVKNGLHFLVSVFRLYPGIKISFVYNIVRRNFFLSTCFCWDSRLSLSEMDQKFKFGGTFGYGNSYLEFLFRPFKVFRLHVKLHDAAGAVRAQEGKGHGYCYMIERGPNQCLLGQVTGLFFCLYVKIFLPPISKSVDFWSSMSLTAPDIQLTEKNTIKEMGLYIDGTLQGFSFCPPKTCKANKQITWNTSHVHGIAWSSQKLDYDEFFAVFYDIKLMNSEVFAQGLEKCRLLTTLLGQNVENLMTIVARKFKILLENEKRTVRGSALVTFSDTKQGFTLPRTKLKCIENGLCNICKFLYVFIVFVFKSN